MSTAFNFESLDHLDWSAQPDPAALSAALRVLPKPSSPSASTSRLILDQDPRPSLLDSSATQNGQLACSTSASTAGIDWLRSSLPSHLLDQALAILRSPQDDNDAAASLWELWGDDGVDHVAEAITRRADILNSSGPGAAGLNANSSSFAPNGANPSGDYSLPPHLSGDGHHRDLHVPGSQVVYQTAEDVAAAKRARKMGQRGKGKGRGDEHGEVDLEEWERIRQQQLAQGPGALVSGNRVSRPRERAGAVASAR